MSNAELIEARDLILLPALSFDQRVRLAALLRLHISDDTITEDNIFQTSADRRFMARYYPGDSYQTSPIAAGRLARYGHTIASVVRGDYSSFATEALAAAAKRGIVDKIMTVILPTGSARTAHTTLPGFANRPTPAPVSGPSVLSQAQRDAIKREIRLLTLARDNLLPDDRNRLIKLLASHYRKGPVTHSNYIFVALNFLRAYFPADYQAEKEKRGEMMTPAMPQQTAAPPPTGQNPGQAHREEAPFALFRLCPPAAAPPPVRLTFVTPRPVDGQTPPPGSASTPAGAHPTHRLSHSQIERQPSQYDGESGTDAVELE